MKQVYATRQEWLEARREVLGGSDIAAILGIGSFTSPLEVYYSKVNPVEERDENDSMRWGTILEPVILEQWAGDEREIDTELMIVRSEQYPFLGASPDALNHWVEEWIEVKNIRSDRDWKASEYGVPERVYAQVQHGLLCSGWKKGRVIALVAGSKLIEVEVQADSLYQQAMVAAAEDFWTRYVLQKTPPPPDGTESSSRALQRAWVAPQGTCEVPYHLLDEYKSAAALLKVAKDNMEKVKQVIEAEMGEAEEATVDGVPVATWKVSTRNAIDITRLRKEAPDIAAKYNKTTPTRTFRLL